MTDGTANTARDTLLDYRRDSNDAMKKVLMEYASSLTQYDDEVKGSKQM